MVFDFDLRLFCENLKATKPPYECPAPGCGRVYKTYIGIQFHLFNYDHENSDGKSSTGSNSDRLKQQDDSKKGHHRQFLPSPSRISHDESEHEQSFSSLSPHNVSSKSQRVVEVNLDGRIHRIDVYEPMNVVARQTQASSSESVDKNPSELAVCTALSAITSSNECPPLAPMVGNSVPDICSSLTADAAVTTDPLETESKHCTADVPMETAAAVEPGSEEVEVNLAVEGCSDDKTVDESKTTVSCSISTSENLPPTSFTVNGNISSIPSDCATQNADTGEVKTEDDHDEEPVVLSADGVQYTSCSDDTTVIVSSSDAVNADAVLTLCAQSAELDVVNSCSTTSTSTETVSKSAPTKLSLPSAEFKVRSDYVRPPKVAATAQSTKYYKFTERTAEELDAIVEYDMDEEDYIWLELANERRETNSLAAVSHETFEALMDRFEKEAFFRTRSSLSPSRGLSSVSIDDDAVCAICMDGECQNANVILFYDLCNLAVHQECYGVPFVPEGQWLCRRCLQSPSRSVDCCLCPNRGGAFKQTSDGRWAHVACALWIPEVGFANHVFLEPVDGLERIPPARRRLTCCVCRRRGAGACIQCHRTNCYTAFHVTCAQMAGLHMKMTPIRLSGEGTSGSGSLGAVRKTAYCDMHTPGLFDEGSLTPAEVKALLKDKMRRARKILAERRHAAPVVSIPVIPEHRLLEITQDLSIEDCQEFVTRLKSYWTLKRRSRNGVPLLRRLQTSHMSRHKDQDMKVEKNGTSQLPLKTSKHFQQNTEIGRAHV